jgi:hypothetical protein
MNEPAAAGMDESTMNFGLLMESAQAHQKLTESHLAQLRAHTLDLDGVVRGEIRRTLIEELAALNAESKRAALALQKLRRSVSMRGALWSVVTAGLCTALPVGLSRWALPSPPEIAALRAKREELAANLAQLERRGGRIEWGRCGQPGRLCVRVDVKAPTYGEKADYYIVQGY